ncbi:hypothetical protein JZ751_003187, partial [Albula glossodonta]
MRKIQHCFTLLKVMVREKFSGVAQREDSPQPSEATSRPVSPQQEAVQKLKDMLQQRDDEIRTLARLAGSKISPLTGPSAAPRCPRRPGE